MNPNISLPQLPSNLDPALRDYLFAWQKLITSKQLDDYSANTSIDNKADAIDQKADAIDQKADAIESRLSKIESSYKNYSNITVKPNASNPNYQIDIEWDSLYIEGILRTSGDFTLDITTSGLLGLDTGSEAVSTWYYLWAIAKADGTVSAILSTSSTSPTMPIGYTLKRLVSAVRNNSSGNFVSFEQKNENVTYTSNQTLYSTTSTTLDSGTNRDISAILPSVSTKFTGYMRGYANKTGSGYSYSVEIRGYALANPIYTCLIYAENQFTAGDYVSASSNFTCVTTNQIIFTYSGSSTPSPTTFMFSVHMIGFEIPL